MRRVISWAGLVLLMLASLGLLAGGWYYSDQLLPAPVAGDAELDVEVLAADEEAGTLTLDVPGPDSGDRGEADDLVELATVGLVGDDAALVLEGPLETTASGVRRRGDRLYGPWPTPGTRVAASVDTYPGDPARSLGLPYELIDVPGELGELPAWQVVPNGATTDTWVVIVHGRGAELSQGNRLLPTLRELGLPSLSISVRNDPGSPRHPDGYGTYGDREWRDLEAAVDHLVHVEDAERIVLAGYSQGASIGLGYLRRSPDAELVEAAVLISPLLSLHETLVLQARGRDIPEPLIPPLLVATRWVSTLRSGLDFGQVEHLDRLDELPDDVPMLVTHGSEDGTVPVGSSQELARRLPEQVTYEEYPGTGHVREWNADRDRFERDLHDFLTAEVLTPAG